MDPGKAFCDSSNLDNVSFSSSNLASNSLPSPIKNLVDQSSQGYYFGGSSSLHGNSSLPYENMQVFTPIQRASLPHSYNHFPTASFGESESFNSDQRLPTMTSTLHKSSLTVSPSHDHNYGPYRVMSDSLEDFNIKNNNMSKKLTHTGYDEDSLKVQAPVHAIRNPNFICSPLSSLTYGDSLIEDTKGLCQTLESHSKELIAANEANVKTNCNNNVGFHDFRSAQECKLGENDDNTAVDVKTKGARTCLACRKAKVRCTKELPTCKRCVRLGKECIQQVRPQGRPSKTSKVERKSSRVDFITLEQNKVKKEVENNYSAKLVREQQSASESEQEAKIYSFSSSKFASNISDKLSSHKSTEICIETLLSYMTKSVHSMYNKKTLKVNRALYILRHWKQIMDENAQSSNKTKLVDTFILKTIELLEKYHQQEQSDTSCDGHLSDANSEKTSHNIYPLRQATKPSILINTETYITDYRVFLADQRNRSEHDDQISGNTDNNDKAKTPRKVSVYLTDGNKSNNKGYECNNPSNNDTKRDMKNEKPIYSWRILNTFKLLFDDIAKQICDVKTCQPENDNKSYDNNFKFLPLFIVSLILEREFQKDFLDKAIMAIFGAETIPVIEFISFVKAKTSNDLATPFILIYHLDCTVSYEEGFLLQSLPLCKPIPSPVRNSSEYLREEWKRHNEESSGLEVWNSSVDLETNNDDPLDFAPFSLKHERHGSIGGDIRLITNGSDLELKHQLLVNRLKEKYKDATEKWKSK